MSGKEVEPKKKKFKYDGPSVDALSFDWFECGDCGTITPVMIGKKPVCAYCSQDKMSDWFLNEYWWRLGFPYDKSKIRKICINCRWFTPNIYGKFKLRFVPKPKCAEGILGDKTKDFVLVEAKEINWNYREKGCDKYELAEL